MVFSSSENPELQEKLHTLSAPQKVLFFIDTPGENSVLMSASEVTPVTFNDFFHYKIRIVAQYAVANIGFQQLRAKSHPWVSAASINERIFPFHSHW